jgi:ketosteroid isomerase-like protein
MSNENVDRLRQGFERFLAGRNDFGVELLDPQVEWDATDIGVPDLEGVYRGVEGVRSFWRVWLSSWETVLFEYELIDAGDRVLALLDQRMRGRSTGIEVAFGKYAHLYTFRNGLIVHWKAYRSQSDALEAAGLRGQALSRQNLDRLRAALDALQADTSEDDWEATLAGAWVELWDPDIEWDASTHPLPDLAGVYRGIEPTRRWWREWLAAWGAVRVEYELIEAGDRVVGVFRQRMRGLYTGIDVASGRYAMVFTFRNGLIVRAKFYARPSEALDAVRLPR